MSLCRLTGVVWIWLLAACCAAEPEQGPDVLENLRGFDAVYASGLTFRGSLRRGPEKRSVSEPITMRLEFTVGGSFQGIVLEAVDDPVLAGVDELAERGIEVAKEGSGFRVDGNPTSTIGVETARAVYVDGTKAADMKCSARYALDRDGELVKSGALYVGNVVPPDAPDLTLQYKKIIWSSGRGVSPYIDEVTDVTEVTSERLFVVAKGFESRVNRGTWELEIEPGAGYLIRKGKFTKSNGSINFEFDNEGSREAKGLVYPASATWTQYFVGESSVDEIRYDEASLSLDRDVLAKAKAIVEDRSRPNTMILDRMGGTPTAMHVDSTGRLIRDDTPPNAPAVESFVSSRPEFKWILLVINLAIVAALVAVWWIWRRTRTSRPQPPEAPSGQ